jgi:hypothetical protein
MDRQLENGAEEESIDLEDIISGDHEEANDEEYLDTMSTAELKKRNAFITEILTGKISRKEINEMSEMDRSGMRMHKLEHEKEEREDEDDVELPEINMMKRHSQKFVERGRIEASGQIYRDCDYLSQEHQKRLEELLGGDLEASPFDCDEL